MIQKLLFRLTIKLGLRHEKRFIRLLAKLEYGVAAFCRKQASLAKQEKHYLLAKMLEAHAISEEKHGKMLASLNDGRDRLTPVSNNGKGRWIYAQTATGKQLTRPNPDPSAKGVKVTWHSASLDEQIFAEFENFDGIGKRYNSLQLFFDNRDPSSFAWADRLAFMHVLEGETQKFYKALAFTTSSEPLRAIASLIYVDESNHADHLWDALENLSDGKNTDVNKWHINKWRSRLFWTKLALLVDLWRFLCQG